MSAIVPEDPAAFAEKVAATLEEIRPRLQKDNGDVELIKIDGNKIFVKMTGACVGCQLANITLQGIQARVIERVGIPVRIIPADAPFAMSA